MGGLTSGSWQTYTYEEIEKANHSLRYLKWLCRERTEPNFNMEELHYHLEVLPLNKKSVIIK